MTEVREWFAGLKFPRTIIGFALMALGTAFSLGAAAVNVQSMPQRVTDLEHRAETSDSLQFVVIDKLDYLQCVVDAMYEGETIGPFDCPKERTE